MTEVAKENIGMLRKIFRFFSKPPFVGIMAFMAVLFVQPLGHIVMIVMEKIVAKHEYWYSPFIDKPPVVPEGYENFSGIESITYLSPFIMGVVGIIIIMWGVRRNTEIAGTWAGFVGASLLWTGWVEFSIHFFSRFYGVKALCIDGTYAFACAENPATKPEYLLMQSSVGFMLVIMLFFVLNNETRCNMFRWMQKHLHLKVGKPTKGLTRNFANIVAIETLTILWFFYVYLMFLYDENFFGEHHWFTYLNFVAVALWSLFLILRLVRFKRMTTALRYAIPTAIIFWNTVEIAGRWNWFGEYWIHPMDHKIASIGTFLFLVIFIFIAIKTAVNKSKQIDQH